MTKTTYPIPLEAIKYLAEFLGLKKTNELKEPIDSITILEFKSKEYLQKIILSSLKEVIDNRIIDLLQSSISKYFDFYQKEIVAKIPVDNLTRKEVSQILNEHFISKLIYQFLKNLPKEYCIIKLDELFKEDISSMKLVMKTLKEDLDWQAYQKYLFKDDIDRYRRWEQGDFLPSFKAISLLGKEEKEYPHLESDFIKKIKFWLVVARAFDEIRKNKNISSYFFNKNYTKNYSVKDIDNAIINEQKMQQQSIESKIIDDYLFLKNNLNLYSYKNDNIKQKTKETLDRVYKDLGDKGILLLQKYHWDHFYALWYVFFGDLDKAIEYYEQAFENGLFKAGDSLQQIIQEALVTTAFYEKSLGKGKRKFLAHLKHASIIFGYELPSMEKEIKKLNHSDVIQDWEVELWGTSFSQFFAEQYLFPNVKYDYLPNKHIITTKYFDIEPNYINPNKMINTKPQLVWFTLKNDIDIVKNLLEKGANVNRLSNSNESALAIALYHLSLSELNNSQNIELFNLISQHKHDKKIVNTSFTKKGYTPLLLAVESGRSCVVQKIIEMGADVNYYSPILQVNALTKIILMISFLTNPRRKVREMMTRSLNDKDKEYIKRTSMGFYPFTNHIPNKFSEIDMDFMNIFLRLEYENMKKYTSLDELYKILELLLIYKANPNHTYNINKLEGFTPLMLAVELNDKKAFELMIKYGGEINQPCFSTIDNKLYYCKDIKERWNSTNIPL